jgi:hypothetical protein
VELKNSQKNNNMAFKMNYNKSSFPFKGKKDELTKTPVGPRAEERKTKITEEEEQVIENMSNQETASEIIQHEMYLKRLREKKDKSKSSPVPMAPKEGKVKGSYTATFTKKKKKSKFNLKRKGKFNFKKSADYSQKAIDYRKYSNPEKYDDDRN